jgi:hypothetical protein
MIPEKELPPSKKEGYSHDGMTREEVSTILGIHTEQVRKIEQTALSKLKNRLLRLYKKEDLL